jgi:uncharacterized membrane protein
MSMSAVESGVVSLDTSSTKSAVAGVTDARKAIFVYAFAFFYAALFFAAAAADYILFFAPRYDLGNMVQTVWSTAHGHFLQMSSPSGDLISRLGVHFDPFLALLAPLWLLWPSPLMLLAVQAIAVASGALPVYWLARKHLGNGGFSVVFAVAYLLYAPTQFNTYTPVGIHAVSFSIPLILYAIWFLDNDRLLWFSLFGVVAATTKEEIAGAVGGLGIWYALSRGRRLVGATIFVVGAAITILNFEVVIPHYAHGNLIFKVRYADIGGTPGGIAKTSVTDPVALIQQMATGHKLFFLILVFVPFLGFWAREPLMLVGALPDLAINLLSSNDKQTTIFYQYTAGIIPFVVAASVLGAAKMRKRRHAPPALLAVVCLLAILSPLVFTGSVLTSRDADAVRAMKRAVKLIPPDARVSASISLGGDVAQRRVLLNFPAVAGADWVIVGPTTQLDIDSRTALKPRIRELRASPHWQRVFSDSGVEVFKRRS